MKEYKSFQCTVHILAIDCVGRMRVVLVLIIVCVLCAGNQANLREHDPMLVLDGLNSNWKQQKL